MTPADQRDGQVRERLRTVGRTRRRTARPAARPGRAPAGRRARSWGSGRPGRRRRPARWPRRAGPAGRRRRCRRPSAIQGRRQMGTRRGGGRRRPARAQARSAASSQPGPAAGRRDQHPVEAGQRAAAASRGSVTQTASPASRSAVDVGRPVLLLVGEHEVGASATTASTSGFLVPPHPRHVEVRRVAAPVGGADQQLHGGLGDGFGQARDQADDPPYPVRDGDVPPQVVERHAGGQRPS